MKRLSQLAAFLIVAIMFTACSTGYYGHLPRAKKSVTKHETVTVKKEVEQQEVKEEVAVLKEEAVNTEVVSAKQGEVIEQGSTNEAKIIITEEKQVVTTKSASKVTKILANKVVKKVTKKLKPKKGTQTQNVSNGTALLLIIIGLVLGLIDGLGAIGGVILVVGVILLLLNLLGASY